MSEIHERAQRARRLRDDEAFREFVQQVRDDAVGQFLSSGAADVQAREEAHAILRALRKLEGTIQTAIDAETLLKKKDRDRNGD